MVMFIRTFFLCTLFRAKPLVPRRSLVNSSLRRSHIPQPGKTSPRTMMTRTMKKTKMMSRRVGTALSVELGCQPYQIDVITYGLLINRLPALSHCMRKIPCHFQLPLHFQTSAIRVAMIGVLSCMCRELARLRWFKIACTMSYQLDIQAQPLCCTSRLLFLGSSDWLYHCDDMPRFAIHLVNNPIIHTMSTPRDLDIVSSITQRLWHLSVFQTICRRHHWCVLCIVCAWYARIHFESDFKANVHPDTL